VNSVHLHACTVRITKQLNNASTLHICGSDVFESTKSEYESLGFESESVSTGLESESESTDLQFKRIAKI